MSPLLTNAAPVEPPTEPPEDTEEQRLPVVLAVGSVSATVGWVTATDALPGMLREVADHVEGGLPDT